jgi:hypothetical protein
MTGVSGGTAETSDLEGSSDHFNGTVGTSSTAVPASAGAIISELFLRNPKANTSGVTLSISFDGGTTFMDFNRGEGFGWSVKGNKTQVHIKASAASTAYQIVMNREPA